MSTDYGVLTNVDMVQAYAYASDQVKRIKCNDSELIRKYCKDDDPQCFKWKQNDSNRIWRMPSYLTNTPCSQIGDNSSECREEMGAPDCIQDTRTPSPSPTGKICGYAPLDVQSGHCHIMSEKLCNLNQTIPYTCNQDECNFLDKDKLANASYVEWHPNTGQCGDDNVTCSLPSVCVNKKCTCKKDDDCRGSSVCNKDGNCEGGGVCMLGNFLLRQWCENPQSRCKKNSDGTYPDECKGSSSTPGVTDVPPFFYNENTGKCFITKDYCQRFGVDYSGGTDCSDSNPCTGEGMACYKGTCTGPGSECTTTTGQKVGEFFVGKTLFRMFKSPNLKCDSQDKENFTQGYTTDGFAPKLASMYESFNKLPETIEKMLDPSMIKSKILVHKNFIQGIDLYFIIWKDSANMDTEGQISYDISQIKKKYPFLLKKRDGLLYIKISKKDIGNNNDLKRIYLSLGSSNWITMNLANTLIKMKESKNFMKE